MSEVSRRHFVNVAARLGATISVGGIAPVDFARFTQQPPARRAVDTIDERAIRDFASGFRGSLIRPSHPDYDAARKLWNARFDRRPGLIARCADAADVKRAVDFGRSEDAVIAVRGGGHSMAGHSMCDGGLVIDLSRMKDIQVERDQRIVRVAPGVVVAELDAVTQAAGLAVVLGD